MTLSRAVLVLFVALALSASFAIPAEDVPETAYDESETLPAESAPTLANAGPDTAASAHVAQAQGRLRLAAESDLCRFICKLVSVFSVPKPLSDLTVGLRC